MSKDATHSGRCECGAVTYEIVGDLRPVVACHCTQCRRSSGHYWAATQVNEAALTVASGAPLKWYSSSPGYERGFCSACGSSLFWRKGGEGAVSIGAGTLDNPTGLKMDRHIFLDDKGDYYET